MDNGTPVPQRARHFLPRVTGPTDRHLQLAVPPLRRARAPAPERLAKVSPGARGVDGVVCSLVAQE